MKRFIGKKKMMGLLAFVMGSILITPVWNRYERLKVGQSHEETVTFKVWNREKNQIFQDTDQRISQEFAISEALRPRVSFWFDIYSRYTSHHKVIHHSLFPWIVYEVVDSHGMDNPDVYMKKRTEMYSNFFRTLHEKQKSSNPQFTQVEKRYLELFETTDSPKKALATASKRIRYQTGQKDLVQKGFLRAQPFLGAMEKEFTKRGLPEELTRLPFVESSFQMEARSRVGAVGVWQFMRRTGRKFLRISSNFDERLSPMKSTVAAAKLLKQNYRILYKEWPLAVTAYNYGPSGLRRAVKKYGSKDLARIIQTHKDKRFSFASSNFYGCFLAILYVEKYKEKLFPRLEIPSPNPSIERIKISKTVRAKVLVRALPLTKKNFLHLNPDMSRAIRKNLKIPKGYTYYMPIEERQKVALDELGPEDKIVN